MTAARRLFGYYPRRLDVQAGPVTIASLANIEKSAAKIAASTNVERDWIYAPRRRVRVMGGDVTQSPYAARIFGLPKTHSIEHASPDNEDQLRFHLWALSFFTGMRLTSTEAGFVDATPIEPAKLVDFFPCGGGIASAVELAEAFWIKNRGEPARARRLGAAVHALFLAKNPRLLEFEEFQLLYTALDACYALLTSLHNPPKDPRHAKRIEWMCDTFAMPTPAWAIYHASKKKSAVSDIRNNMIHEALFEGEPLGFSLLRLQPGLNLTLEMHALICRFIVALIGAEKTDYVRSPVNTRNCFSLKL